MARASTHALGSSDTQKNQFQVKTNVQQSF